MTEDLTLYLLLPLIQVRIILSGGRLNELMEREQVLHTFKVLMPVLQLFDLLVFIFEVQLYDLGGYLSVEITVPETAVEA